MTDQPLDPMDNKALQYCLGILRGDSDAHYKEVRRAARADQGITLKRHVWTLARQQLGLKGDDEGGEEGGEQEARPRSAAPAAPSSQPSASSWIVRPRQPAWNERGGHPAWRGDAPRRDEPQQRPDDQPRRRPAWAVPQDGTPDPAPPRHAPSGPAHAPRPKELPEILKQARNPVEFMVGYLQQVSRDANFAEVESAAEEFGFTVYPTTFGRAQAIVGIVEAPQRAVQTPLPVTPPAAPFKPAPMAPSAKPVDVLAPFVVQTLESTKSASGPIDPMDGLLAFFTALDQRGADKMQARKLMQQMLHAVEEALHPEPEEPVAAEAQPATPAE